eukprot:806580-Rhodomonas_salina.1
MSGTYLAYGTTKHARPGTDLAYGATSASPSYVRTTTRLRYCPLSPYAMPGTGIERAVLYIHLCVCIYYAVCYAMSGTDVLRVVLLDCTRGPQHELRAADQGTRPRNLLCDARYRPTQYNGAKVRYLLLRLCLISACNLLPGDVRQSREGGDFRVHFGPHLWLQ